MSATAMGRFAPSSCLPNPPSQNHTTICQHIAYLRYPPVPLLQLIMGSSLDLVQWLTTLLLCFIGHYSSDTRDLSPDAMAAAYPDRPIRPMPKRRLRERLSPNVADAIVYPPTAPAIAPLFHYPYHAPTEEDRSPKPYPVNRTREDDVEHNYISRRNLKEVDSDEEYTELAYRSRYSRHSPDPTGRSYRFVQKPETAKYPKPDPPASTTSSADGYDSFENTNNKKKRKIPTPGDAISNGILQANDMASLTVSNPTTDEPPVREEPSSGPGQYYSPPASNLVQGLSGPGRGRYGRVRSGRSPLRNLSDNPTNWANGRTPRQRQAPWSPGKYQFFYKNIVLLLMVCYQASLQGLSRQQLPMPKAIPGPLQGDRRT